MTWNIVCDSSSDLLPAELIPGKLSRKIVPLTILVGENHFVDDETLDVSELLACMAQETEAASTACPAPALFAEAFASADCSLCFTISGALSGTYAAAVTARDMVLEEHPEKKIFVLDTCSTSGSLLLLDRLAQKLIREGNEDFDDICRQLQACKDNQYTLCTLESFDNLVKNGRMKPLLGTLLHTLGIHVVADVTRGGSIQVQDKARGEKKTYKAIIARMEKFKDYTGAEVIISHCQNPEGAEKLKAMMLETMNVKSVELLECRGLTTFYAMEKGLIIVG